MTEGVDLICLFPRGAADCWVTFGAVDVNEWPPFGCDIVVVVIVVVVVVRVVWEGREPPRPRPFPRVLSRRPVPRDPVFRKKARVTELEEEEAEEEFSGEMTKSAGGIITSSSPAMVS